MRTDGQNSDIEKNIRNTHLPILHGLDELIHVVGFGQRLVDVEGNDAVRPSPIDERFRPRERVFNEFRLRLHIAVEDHVEMRGVGGVESERVFDPIVV